MAQAKVKSLQDHESREQVYLEIVDLLNTYTKAERAYIAETAGVSITTVRNWCSLRTWSPQIRTLAHVARALGYDIVLKRMRPAPPKLKIVGKKK